MYSLSEKEIQMIALAIEVAQFECVLPETEENAELKALLDKLGICYESRCNVILDK